MGDKTGAIVYKIVRGNHDGEYMDGRCKLTALN